MRHFPKLTFLSATSSKYQLSSSHQRHETGFKKRINLERNSLNSRSLGFLLSTLKENVLQSLLIVKEVIISKEFLLERRFFHLRKSTDFQKHSKQKSTEFFSYLLRPLDLTKKSFKKGMFSVKVSFW